jgi:hypothetical protein
MKKTFANLVQKSLVAALLVFGVLLFGTTSVEAQTSAQDLNVNWVDAGEAMLRVKSDVESLQNDPQVNVVGSDSYVRVHYYKSVYRRLDGGEPVYLAVINSLGNTSSNFAAPETIPGVTLNQAQRNTLLTHMKTRLAL